MYKCYLCFSGSCLPVQQNKAFIINLTFPCECHQWKQTVRSWIDMRKINGAGVGRSVCDNKIKSKVDAFVEKLDQPSLLLSVSTETAKITPFEIQLLTFYRRTVKQMFVINFDGFGNPINLEKIGKFKMIFERMFKKLYWATLIKTLQKCIRNNVPHNLLLIRKGETESESELVFSICVMLLCISFSIKF